MTTPVYDPRLGARRWGRRQQVWLAAPLSTIERVLFYAICVGALVVALEAMAWGSGLL